MLNLDVEKFLGGINGALSLRKDIAKCADEISKKGFKNLFLIGSGGSLACMYPLEYIVKSNSKMEVHVEIAAEFVLMNNQHIGKESLCIFASDSGDTKETVAAARFCKDKGATTIGFVGNPGTPLTKACDHAFVNSSSDYGEALFIQLLSLIFRLMYKKNEFPKYNEFIKQLDTLPSELLKAKEYMDDKAKAFAEHNKNVDYHMVVGSGILWGKAYSYAMCILEEMQWIPSKSIHAAEFFHGTLELVESDTSIILLYGEDETRPLMDRVKRFVTKFSDEVTIIDTKTQELPGISKEFRKFISPIIITTMLERISCHLSHVRNHPLSRRRYYRQMEY